MPELPEVEASRKLVENHCLGQPIARAKVADDSNVLCNVGAKALEEALVGRTIIQAHRKGKHMWLQLDRRPWPTFQFGMSGSVLVKGVKGVQYKRSAVNDKEEWPSKYSKVLVELPLCPSKTAGRCVATKPGVYCTAQLENGVEMAFTDKRRFARVRLLQDPPTELPISELGPDAYLEYPDEDTFVQSIQSKKGKVSIKGVILDQTFLAGIGNWIADEVLYQARIHPNILASSMSSEDCRSLYRAIREVLQYSVTANADHENFPKAWLFHLRWNKRPGSLDGNTIEFIKAAGRTSAYVPALQTVRGEQILLTAKKSSKLEFPVEEEEPPVEGETLVDNNELTTENGWKAKARGTKSMKSNAGDVEEVIVEERLSGTNTPVAHEPASASEKASKRRKKSDVMQTLEDGKAETNLVTTKATEKGRRGRKIHSEFPKAELNPEIIVAGNRRVTRLQSRKKE